MDKIRILVVDDDESVLEYLTAFLSMGGYEVTAAGTATEAIGKLRTVSFPLVLSDIVMPGVNGIELLKTIKKNSPDTVVIMLTGHGSADYAIQSLNEGAFAYLRKPVNLDELNAALRNAYHSYTLTADNARLLDELKKAKEYNEAIIEHLLYLIVATDENGIIRKVNRAVTELLGYGEQELDDQPLSSIFSRDFEYRSWNEMTREKRVIDFPVGFRTKNGRDITVLFTGTIMKDAAGKVLGFLGTAKA